MSTEQDWRSISDKIISIINQTPVQDRLRVFQEQLSLLPEPPRKMVEHFVSIALLVNGSEERTSIAMSRHVHVSFITVVSLIAAIVLTVAGIYLVSISDDNAVSKISILGANIETGSVGVACLALAALTYIFTVRSAIAKI